MLFGGMRIDNDETPLPVMARPAVALSRPSVPPAPAPAPVEMAKPMTAY